MGHSPNDCRELVYELREEIEEWADKLPHFREGVDGRENPSCRTEFDEYVSPLVKASILALEGNGRSYAATLVRESFGKVAELASDMDAWLADHPSPESLPGPVVDNMLQGVGDPDDLLIWDCYSVAEMVLGSLPERLPWPLIRPYPCEKCGANAEMHPTRGLQCPNCNGCGYTVGYLEREFIRLGPLASPTGGDEALRELRALVVDKWGDWSLATLGKFIDWAVTFRGMDLEAVRELDLAAAVTCLRSEGRGNDVFCHVTLTQMAAIVQKSKPTVRRLYDNGSLPAPAIEPGNGKANEWLWSEVRPVLENEFGRKLPEVFPGDQFVR